MKQVQYLAAHLQIVFLINKAIYRDQHEFKYRECTFFRDIHL